MKPQKIIAFSAIVFGFVVLLVCLAGNYMTVTAQKLNIPLIVMRNGEEVPTDQIRSVQYFITFLRPHPPKGIPAAMLREATNKQGRYVLAAEFTRYVYGPLSGFTRTNPEFHSIFVYVTFVDGSKISLSIPAISDERENEAIFVDSSNAQL